MTDDEETERLALTARVRAVEEQLDGYAEPIRDIHEKLDALLQDAATRPRCFHWPDLDPDDAQDRWTALLAWVQNVLCARYPAVTRELRACWWQHPDAVDAVTAAWFVWLAAYQSGSNSATDVADWIEKHLPALADGVKASLTSCHRGHEPNVPTMEALNTAPTTLP